MPRLIIIAIQCLLPPITPPIRRLRINPCINERLIEIQHFATAPILNPMIQSLSIRRPALCKTGQVLLQNDRQRIILNSRDRTIVVSIWNIFGMVSWQDREDVIVRLVGVCMPEPVRDAGECEIADCDVETLEGRGVGLGPVVDRWEEGLGKVGESASGDLGEVKFHVSGKVVGCAGCRWRVAAGFIGVVGCEDSEGFVIFALKEELSGKVFDKVSVRCWA